MTPLLHLAAQTGAEARHAALLAHALAPEDQDWLLAALPPLRRQALQALLTELRTLGLPRDVRLLDGLRPQPASLAPDTPPDLQALDRQAVNALARRLQQEPPALAARLLAMRRWRWSAALLQAMDPGFAEAVRGSGTVGLAPELDAALCRALVLQLRGDDTGRRHGRARALWRTTLAAVRRLGARA